MELYTTVTFSMLKAHMTDWAKSLNGFPILKKPLNIPPDSLFISFNYTNTLERYYKIHPNRINYIHGNSQKKNCNLIFGHDWEQSDLDYDVSGNQEGLGRLYVRSFFSLSRKPVEKILKLNSNFWEKLYMIDEIVIIVHSLSKVDMPYFKYIKQHVSKNCIWRVSYYNENDIDNYVEALKECRVKSELIYPFDIYPRRPKQLSLF